MKMTKQVRCGDVLIGGGAPISIQSMTNVDSRDEKGLNYQICELTSVGCEIVRVAVPDMESAEVFGRLKQGMAKHIPLVADIHFDYRLAIAAIEAGADKVRINPGNIGSIENLTKVVKSAKEHDIPIRVGVNSGSLEKEILEKYGRVTAQGLAESALDNLRVIENLGYDKLVVSIKSSDPKMNFDAHKILAEKTDHPIHIGITEAGTPETGRLKSAVGMGALLLEGIGDTMRVSLTADPVEEVLFAKALLRTCGLRKTGIDFVSCPTCGRTKVNLRALAEETQERLKPLSEKLAAEDRSLKVAVMGCAVNGPGEAREADFGICGGDGRGLIFSRGEIVETTDENKLVDELVKLIEENI